MALSSRIFIVGADETLYRLAGTKFSGMLRDPDSHLLPRIAGQRVRIASAIVDLQDRVPYRVVRVLYEILRFDDQGRLDIETFGHQNAAIVDVMLENTLTNNTGETTFILKNAVNRSPWLRLRETGCSEVDPFQQEHA